MFLPNSRYANVAQAEAANVTGETVTALKLRRLTPVSGNVSVVEGGDRLDLYAHRINGDATQFWHVADANSALDSRTLVETVGDTLILPRA
jgi:hypothetical protein